MTITNVLAYIDGRSSVENTAAAAFMIAARHSAHVEGLFVRKDFKDMVTNAPIYAIDGALPLAEQHARNCLRKNTKAERRETKLFNQVRNQFAFAQAKDALSTVQPIASWTIKLGRPELLVANWRAPAIFASLVGVIT